MTTFGSVCPDDLHPKQNQDELHAVPLIKEKRYRKIKEGAYSDGIAQVYYITKGKQAAPMVLMEKLLAQLMTKSFEDRAMEIFDVLVAYVNA